MRYVRAGGMVLSVGLLLAGLGLQSAPVTRSALLVCAAAMTVCALEQPGPRVSWFVPALCLMLSGWFRLGSLTDQPMFVLPTAQGDWLVPAGESAYRTWAACILSLAVSAWLGETAVEALLPRPSEDEGAGYAGAPVRLCAGLLTLAGCAAAALPGLSEWIVLPALDARVLPLLFAATTAALACYGAAARFRPLAFAMVLLYLASGVFAPDLFPQRALLAAFFALLLLARCEGWAGLLGPLCVGGLLAAVFLCPADGSARALLAQRLAQALRTGLVPGENGWILRLCARLGYPGLCAAGAIGGAVCFFLGRLTRESFVYAAPALMVLVWGSRVLLLGESALPDALEAVAFGAIWGLCLIVGCIRRSQRRAARR